MCSGHHRHGAPDATDRAVLVIFDLDNTLVDSRIDFAGLRRALLDLWETVGPLPAPRGTTGTSSRSATSSTAATSAALTGETTTSGWPVSHVPSYA